MMSGKTDLVKGRIKEAVGALTDNDQLRDEGKVDQVVGKVKQAVGKAKQAIRKAADTIKKSVK